MANFPETNANLPTVDKDGGAIDNNNPLTLEDITVREIARTDPVLGMPPDRDLTDPLRSPINTALRALFLRDIFMYDKIVALENVDNTVSDATTSQKGIVELATDAEARGRSRTDLVITPSGLDAALNALPAPTAPEVLRATTFREGIIEIATAGEADGKTDNIRAMTALLVERRIQASLPERATTTRQGIAEIATQAEVNSGSDNERFVTSETLKNANFLANIVPAATAIISNNANPSGTSYDVRRNIVIGRMLFLEIVLSGQISSGSIWTIGGGAWRIMSSSVYLNTPREYMVVRITNSQSNDHYLVGNVRHNSDNTQFQVSHNMNANDIILITAILH